MTKSPLLDGRVCTPSPRHTCLHFASTNIKHEPTYCQNMWNRTWAQIIERTSTGVSHQQHISALNHRLPLVLLEVCDQRSMAFDRLRPSSGPQSQTRVGTRSRRQLALGLKRNCYSCMCACGRWITGSPRIDYPAGRGDGL